MRKPLHLLPLTLLVACTTSELHISAVTSEAPQPIIPAEGEIYLNQVGFAPSAPKIAILQSSNDTPLNWILLDKIDNVVGTDESLPLGYSKRAGQDLHRIDFSHIKQSGEAYKLRINGFDSHPFDIKPKLYSQLKYDALSYFYHNRAKDPIEAKYVGAAHARPAGHPSELATCFSGPDKWDTLWPACEYELDVAGGWYDAGDHGKYVVNSGISVWTLLNAYEQFGAAFEDGKAKIPEAGNGVNDLLDEARTNIEFMLAMQVPKGQSVWVASGKQDKDKPLNLKKIENAGGLVHHKVHAKKWAGDAVYPHEFTQERFLYPPSTGATLNVAAIGAYCARLWRDIDAAFSARCLAAAQDAWDAAQRYNNIYAYSNFDGGGPYGDKDYRDEFYWAAQELAITTQQSQYTKAAQLYSAEIEPLVKAEEPSFNSTHLLGMFSKQDPKDIGRAADLILADTSSEPLHIPYDKAAYKWGSNSELANRAIILGHAYNLTQDVKYRDGVIHLMDYLLGRNPLGQSYISGYGKQTYVNPHHRHWSHSNRDGAPIVPSGVLSGGPNNDNMSDPIAKNQIGKCAAQTCWTDHYTAWTQNEITINWNAPLVWMASFLDTTEP